MFKKYLTNEQALQKLKQYCGYQERSHQEVRQKLYDLGVRKAEHDELIASLIEQDYLNEERFVSAYAGGRFRIKQWGRVRIRYELRQRQISDYLVRKALAAIPEADYQRTLEKLLEDKYDSLRSEQYLVRKKKTLDYMTAKGYESNLVLPALSALVAVRKSGAGDA